MTAMVMTACTGQKAEKVEATQDNFNYVVDQFADLQILRYQVPGFESFSLKQKQLLYHLSEAALMGRDILFDQNCRYNLPIRRALEAVYTGYKGDRTDPQFVALETYLKRVWFANGIHHHYAEDKFVPGFTPEFFQTCISFTKRTSDRQAAVTIRSPKPVAFVKIRPARLAVARRRAGTAFRHRTHEGRTFPEARRAAILCLARQGIHRFLPFHGSTLFAPSKTVSENLQRDEADADHLSGADRRYA